ncbi:MAG: hypothetical protein EOQ86_16470 [Mesorhizobium sp.]|uniref:hypothetical protein n=1 Tax=Mesorhizobium sp. TaxID=1871066 RepID=UPI000FE94C07|nr:hypothetical protein [Mesorhizobium sp.]RWH78868.1 MAG: hypothetical protein EOQ85_14925 [Mesorhizobium sp.]RWH81460.1 MAG: hypothetical protein EOQ86_16470 [Mesorhizobium sp.]RWI07746.1 MAG: hypothetical protein EOQ90_21625 [Mesorhizobium sp.]RWI18763.1 MAG: hypothetical protein EOQ91_14555 [Mesorhizobium sp.]RWM34663.1 MAG: hypothetical protein EOR77_13725 [Mesorhizobium sp.]
MTRMELARVWPPTRDAAGLAGHKPMSPVEAIRRKCLDCSGQQLAEVKLCETVTCPLWPFRAGRHPYTRKCLLEVNSEQRPSTGTPVAQNRSSSGIGLQQHDCREGEAKAGQDAGVASGEAG